MGRTYLLKYQVLEIAGRELEDEVLTQAKTHLNESLTFLRQAGRQDHLPRGLLARAALWRVCGERERGRQGDGEKEYFERAERDLGEVEQVAGRSGMLIFQIEAALERCRLAFTREEHDEARRTLDEAQALVKKTEKRYEPHVPDWDEWEPPAYVGVFRKGEIVGYHCRNDEIAALDEELRGLGA